MNAALIAEMRAEAEKMWQERLATKATHNRTMLLQRLKLIRRAADALEQADRDHRLHVDEDGRTYAGCTVCDAEIAGEPI